MHRSAVHGARHVVQETVRTVLAVHAALAVVAIIWMLVTALRRSRREHAARIMIRANAHHEGPPTLHPVIDGEVCIGSGACVRACPEDRALVIANGRGHLAHASGCIGHGECLRACPVDAITLVFGSARRGVDLPEVAPTFESSQPGLYVAGELGGMGLISTAVRQGVKAVEAMAASLATGPASDTLPLLVIGAGPAGIAAALTAKRLGVRARWIEKETSIGGAVRMYPRGKIVMTTPVELPLYGRVHLRRTTKPALIELWGDVLSSAEIAPEFGVTVLGVVADGDALIARTTAGEIRARRVLLATGRRGRPRRLSVDGEELAHVQHHLHDPTEHAGERIVVIGGGDVAVEAALALAEHASGSITVCHRGARFDRAKLENQERLAAAEADGTIRVIREVVVERFAPNGVAIGHAGETQVLPADRAFVMIGSDLPTELLGASGIRVQTHFGDRPAVTLR